MKLDSKKREFIIGNSLLSIISLLTLMVSFCNGFFSGKTIVKRVTVSQISLPANKHLLITCDTIAKYSVFSAQRSLRLVVTLKVLVPVKLEPVWSISHHSADFLQ
jgi:hypothetical protein